MSFLPSVVPVLKARVMSMAVVRKNPWLQRFCDHPAGPFTIHFWAPGIKWCITIANIADLTRPVDKVSAAQQTAVAATGIIWSYYSLVIIPKNWSLFSVNAFMGISGLAQLGRKALAYMNDDKPAGEAPAIEDEKTAAPAASGK